jgi:hypothetical protein
MDDEGGLVEKITIVLEELSGYADGARASEEGFRALRTSEGVSLPPRPRSTRSFRTCNHA